jgi:hypothetical protein
MCIVNKLQNSWYNDKDKKVLFVSGHKCVYKNVAMLNSEPGGMYNYRWTKNS